jgi:AcrR family transcriptional regulator
MTVLELPSAPSISAPSITEPGQRVIDAALRCIARWGLAKTTFEDIAREAGCSRATVYRLFPGGKDALVEAVATSEVTRFFAGLADRFAATDSLEDLLVAGITEAGQRLHDHAALQFLLAHEPEAVLPHFAFRSADAVLATAAAFAAPYLARYLPADTAPRAGEWVARIVLSYISCPADGVDLADEASVRHLVKAFVLPGLESHQQGR